MLARTSLPRPGHSQFSARRGTVDWAVAAAQLGSWAPSARCITVIPLFLTSVAFVQSLSHVPPFATPQTAAWQASLSFTVS